MLGENIRALRRAKGMSQEELAARLHVVRQTISKWEKGLSVPDADLLQRLADIFETDVAALLGAPQQQEAQDAAALLSQQLANINAQLAEKNRRSRRIWRTVAGVLIGLAVLYLLLIVFSLTAYRTLSFEDTVDSYYSAPASVGE